MSYLDLAYEAWPGETPPPVVRLLEAIEAVRAAAKLLGLNPEELYAAQAPFAMRADAWMHRSSRLLGKAGTR